MSRAQPAAMKLTTPRLILLLLATLNGAALMVMLLLQMHRDHPLLMP